MLKKILLFAVVAILVLGCGEQQRDSDSQFDFEAFIDADTLMSAPASTTKPYSIQIAAFRNQSNAVTLTRQLSTYGLPSYIDRSTTTDDHTLYRVQVGPFATEQEAKTIAEKLKSAGYREAFIKKHDFEPDTTVTQREPVQRRIRVTKPARTLNYPGRDERMPVNVPPDYAVPASETFTRELTSQGSCSHPGWSPSGREIAFYKQERGTTGIYTIGTGGGAISKIIESTRQRQITSRFSWSPKGERLAFVAIEPGEASQKMETLYIINKDGSKLQALLNQSEVPMQISDMRWSPDGYNIAFNTNYGQINARSDRIQHVTLAAISILIGARQNNKLNKHSKHISDPSNLSKTNWTVGWQSNSKFIFLSTCEDEIPADDFVYEIWSYSTLTKQRSVIKSGPVIKNCKDIHFIPDQDAIIYTAYSAQIPMRLVSFDIYTGEETVLFSAHTRRKPISSIQIAGVDEIFLLSVKSSLSKL